MEPKVSEANLVRVLFLAADPGDQAKIHLGRELQEIRGRLKNNTSFELVDHLAVKPSDVLQTIINYKPHIVHFAGHGLESGDLCFEDDQGRTKPMPPEALSSLFRLVTEHVKCVIVNTCFSEKQAVAIAQYIPTVIGTMKEIGDKAAISFSTGFYTALEANLSQQNIQKAFEIGRVSIQFDGNMKEKLTPILLLGAPEIRFLSEVEIAMPNVMKTNSTVSKIFRQALVEKGRKMGLSIDQVEGIINKKVLEENEYKDKLNIYEESFKNLLREEYPLSTDTREALEYFQNELNIRNEDISAIERKVLKNTNWETTEYYYDRGKKQHSLENYQRAVDYFTESINLRNDYSAAYYERGNTYFTMGMHDLAINDYDKALECNNNWESKVISDVYFKRGYVHYYYKTSTDIERNFHLEKALEDWNKTIELSPEYSTAYYNRGLCNQHFKNFKAAIDDYKKSIEFAKEESKSTIATTYARIGLCYDRLGNSKLADEYYEKGYALVGGNLNLVNGIDKELD